MSRLSTPLTSLFGRLFRKQPGARLFEGIEVALAAILLVLVAVALAAPRPAVPRILPLPQPDRRTLSALEARERERALSARRTQLPFEVRAVGETFRRVGASVRAGKRLPKSSVGELLDHVARALEKHGPEPLLALRAVQGELFVAATRAWEQGGEIPADLRELGGDFPEVARASGWLAGRRLMLDDRERALLFRARFGELTALAGKPPFAATLDERRAVYALLLEHPLGSDAGARARAQYQSIQALAKLDPDYPAALARGVLLYRAGAFESAADEFRSELSRRGDGPWTLRAKNHLLAALAQAPAAE